MYTYMYRETKYVDKTDSKLFVSGLVSSVIHLKGDHSFLSTAGVYVYIQQL